MNKANNQPAVSVVMCTFNGELYLKEQIDSILAQTYPFTEFLIFDDCSTDNTFDIISAYAQKHAFIRLQKNPVNLGYNYNYEQALKAASCEVIAISDQDDVWHPQKLERMIITWRSESPLIHCDSQRFEEAIPKSNPKRHLYQRFKGTDTKKLFLFNSINGHALLLRKSFLPLIMPFQKNIYYDWWAGVVASCNGGVDYIDEVLVYQRVHRRNISIDDEGTECEKLIRRRAEAFLHLQKFLAVPALKEKDRHLGRQLLTRMTHLISLDERFRFFLFLLQNRSWIFYIKQRTVSIFSHVKHAGRWAFY